SHFLFFILYFLKIITTTTLFPLRISQHSLNPPAFPVITSMTVPFFSSLQTFWIKISGFEQVRIYKGEWKLVGGYNINMKFAEFVCKLMDCGSLITVRRRELTPREAVWGLDSSFDGSNLTECRKYLRTEMDFTEITCSGKNIDGSFNVFLQVRTVSLIQQTNVSNNSWSIVCEDDFDQQDAEVVCRELDCGAPSFLQGALYGETEAPEWSREFLCEGHESVLLKCRNIFKTLILIFFSGSTESIRLVNGDNRCSGRLEVKSNNSWSIVCEDDFDQQDAEVVCRELGCGAPSVLQGALYGETEAPEWSREFLCEGHESALLDCKSSELTRWTCPPGKAVEIPCSGRGKDSIRLVNGDNRCSGRLEVKSNTSWSIVCEDDFDQQDAEVVCRELGCGAPSVLQGALYGETEAPEWSREFLCEGHESALLDCKSSSSSQKCVLTNCISTECRIM
uniref:SRCR domain-containing protein n=1 Tax=Oryzias melastigma TaxID=30732 RepID=A0A3B3DMF0_ORYME